MITQLSTKQMDIINEAQQAYFTKGKYQEFIKSLSGEDVSVISTWMYEKQPKILTKFDEILPGMFQDSQLNCEMVIPSSIKTIGKMAFCNSNFSSFKISDSVEKIEELAFSNCANLRKIILPQNLKAIPAECFVGCKNLSQVYMPAGVTDIHLHAFADCSPHLKIFTPFDERGDQHIQLMSHKKDIKFLQEAIVDSGN